MDHQPTLEEVSTKIRKNEKPVTEDEVALFENAVRNYIDTLF